MEKVLFSCGWGQNPNQLLQRFSKQTRHNSGRWLGKIEGVDNPSDADWLVIIGAEDSSLIHNIPVERRIYIQRELCCNGYYPPDVEAGIKLDYNNSWCAGIWWIETPFDVLVEENNIIWCHDLARHSFKPFKISAITSAYENTLGQKLRMRFLREYVKKYPGELMVYGKHENELRNLFGKDYAGSLEMNGPNSRNGDKSGGLRPYRCSFVFENCSSKNYFSEKLLDSYLSWTIPLYWGCSNVTDFFPPESLFWMDIEAADIEEEIETAHYISQGGMRRDLFDGILASRVLVMYKYNLWAMIENIIHNGELVW